MTTNPVANFIGTSSYSIYLWHWPVATALTLRGLKEDWGWAAVGIGLAIALGHLSYRWIEMPSRDWRRLRRSSEWLCYGAAASLLITCSLLIAYSAGMPSRLGTDEKLYEATAAAISDWSQPRLRAARVSSAIAKDQARIIGRSCSSGTRSPSSGTRDTEKLRLLRVRR